MFALFLIFLDCGIIYWNVQRVVAIFTS